MRSRKAILLVLFPTLLILPLFTAPTTAQQGIVIQKTWGGMQEDAGNGVAVDSSGNIFVVGGTDSFGPLPPATAVSLLKYDSSGNLLWQKVWFGDHGGREQANGVAVDKLGNVYVTGETTDFGGGGEDVLIMKVDSFSGALIWAETWGGSSDDVGRSIALDGPGGNIYVTGWTRSFGAIVGNFNLFLLHLNPAGGLLGVKTWGGASNVYGTGVAVDSAGNIYATAWNNTCLCTSGDNGLLLKLNSSDALVWQRMLLPIGSDENGISVDSSGDIYVAGNAGAIPFYSEVLLQKFDTDGNILWQETWGTGGGFGDLNEGSSVAVDLLGNAYVTGSSYSFGAGDYDVIILTVDSAGNLVWQTTWGGPGREIGNGIALDPSADPVVTGYVAELPPYLLGSGNNTLGTPAFSLGIPSFTLDTPTSFTLGTHPGSLISASGSQIYAGMWDEFLIKYGQLPTVHFNTDPAVGGITFNGTMYTDGENGNFTYGNYTAMANVPVGFEFTSWATSGGVTVTNSMANPAIVSVAGSGTLKANFVQLASGTTPLVFILASLTTSVVLIFKRRQHPS